MAQLSDTLKRQLKKSMEEDYRKAPACKANTFQRKAIFLIDEQFISGLSDREARKLEQSSARSANARATPAGQLVIR